MSGDYWDDPGVKAAEKAYEAAKAAEAKAGRTEAEKARAAEAEAKAKAILKEQRDRWKRMFGGGEHHAMDEGHSSGKMPWEKRG